MLSSRVAVFRFSGFYTLRGFFERTDIMAYKVDKVGTSTGQSSRGDRDPSLLADLGKTLISYWNRSSTKQINYNQTAEHKTVGLSQISIEI